MASSRDHEDTAVSSPEMPRRAFLATIAGGVLAAPLAAQAQRAGKLPRVGYVSSNIRTPMVDAFDQGLQDGGYVVGQNVMVVYRYADGRLDRLPTLVGEVLSLGVDILFAATPYAIRVVRKATHDVPIVGVDLETDPITAGWVTTLARPGGNLTGFFLDMPEVSGKMVQFLAEAVPRLERVAVLWDMDVAAAQFKATEGAAQAAKLKLRPLGFRQPREFSAMFDRARQSQALVLLSSPSVFPNLARLADLALEHRLPAISVFPQFAAAGGLIGYGPDLTDLYRRGAGYVCRILKGDKAGDMPIQRPTAFHLAINLKTAKALGLTIPPSLLQRADQVLE